MIKRVGNVTLDYEFYDPDMHYSDGDIENTLLQAASENRMEELLYSSNEWAVLYHCSNIRENLLDWYPFKKEGTLLEVGSGCGALTGLFSRKVSDVTCIELSEQRSLINAYRHQECDNIKILLGNFQDIRIEEKFDYITLIGVWEYAEQYIGGKSPYLDMLKKLRNYLKSDGKLLIAIENKMGLKYWNGAPEDHLGMIYGGLNDYVDAQSVRTFSKQEIESILPSAGWKSWKFYYPMPDYKLPDTIYTDDRLPNPGELRNYRKDYSSARIYNFYDATVADQLCSDGIISYFANSFLIECGLDFSDMVFAKYNRIRNEDYQIATIIRKVDGAEIVQKEALTCKAQKHILRMSSNVNSILNVQNPKGGMQGAKYVTDYVQGQDLDASLYPYRNDKEALVQKIREILQNHFVPDEGCLIDFTMTDDYRRIFGEQYISGAKCLEVTNVDMIFSNLRITEEGCVFCIDNEWVFEFPIPYEYVLWRSLSNLYYKYMVYLKNKMTRNQFLREFHLDENNFQVYGNMDLHFYRYSIGNDYTEKYRKSAMTYNLRFV